ncbi:MAG: cytochrome b/b6 domain-containing protein [Hyphomonadaceae bacterium]
MSAAKRYTSVAILLHWAIAAGILLNALIGFWMHNAIEEAATMSRAIEAYQLHKSIGLLVLGLSLVRLGWRLTHPPPPLPAHMPAWEKIAALAAHWLFYALIIAIPLSGWVYVSTQWREDGPFNIPTLFFGLFSVPHLFGLAHAPEHMRADVAHDAVEIHEALVKATLILLVLHVAAALKHAFVDRDEVLSNMVPGLNTEAPPEPKRTWTLRAGFALIALGLIATGFAFVRPPPRTEAALSPQAEDYAAGAAGELQLPQAQQEAEGPPLPTVTTLGENRQTAASEAEAAAPAEWRVNPAASEIAFSGSHAAVAFRGTFSRWRADIRFDPENLQASEAVVTVETASASDGISMHDQSLPTREWFNVADYPTAIFRTTRIRHREGAEYEARGTLTIKGREIDLDLPFTLTIEGNAATMQGRVSLDRRDANLGMESDPDADYVSRRIAIDVRVEAVRQP